MGVTQDKGRTKPRAMMTAQHPSSPRATSGTSPTSTLKTTVASAVPLVRRKEEEKLRGTSAQSSAKSMNINNNTNETKVVLPSSEAKNEKKNNDKNETENSLILGLGELSLNEDNDLNKKIKNLSIKDSEKEKEKSEESDLVSRGPDRICAKGPIRTAPYLYQQHIVSSDKHGGGTVLFPNISTAHTAISYNQNLHQGYVATSLQKPSEDNSTFTIDNGLNENDLNMIALNSELEKILHNPKELTPLSADDVDNYLPSAKEDNLNINDVDKVLPSAEEDNDVSRLSDSDINYINKILDSNADEKAIQPIKQELWEGGKDKHLAPTTPDSAYDSDECSVGSPSSVTSGTSGTSGISEISGTSSVMRMEREKVVTMSTPYIHVATQPTNLQGQTGFAPVSNSPVIQTVPVSSGMLLVWPKQVMPPQVLPQLQRQQQPQPMAPVMPPYALPQQHPQPLAQPTTPPPSPQGLRLILPGINIPAECNKCSEPAITRMRSVMQENIKDSAWALMFAYHDSKFTDENEDGNMLLSTVLTNYKKIKSPMEILYTLVHRLKTIISGNIQMASKLLASPNKNGHTPLNIACRFLQSTPQNALAVRFLADTMVEEGLAIGEEVDVNGNSLLHRLCLCGDEACYIMAELLSMKDRMGKSVFDVNKKNNEGKTPLHIAAQTHSDRISCAVLAQLLMRSGADVSVKEGCAGNTVFHLVARESCDPNLLLTLLAKTSYASKVINEKNFNEDSPLHMVAANHAIPSTRQRLAVQHMIEYGADPKLQNKSRKVPLNLVPTDRKQDIKNVLYHKRQVLCHE